MVGRGIGSCIVILERLVAYRKTTTQDSVPGGRGPMEDEDADLLKQQSVATCGHAPFFALSTTVPADERQLI
jgi:hypothetical protein